MKRTYLGTYRQYYWKEKPGSKIQDVVLHEIGEFKKQYGYTPWIIRIRSDEMIGAKFPKGINVDVVEKTIQPAHFQLGPIIYRRPVIKQCERIPVK